MGFPEIDEEQFASQFGPRDLDAMRQWQERYAQLQWEERKAAMHWAPVLCRCTRWYDFRFPDAPQADCPVHTAMALNPFTGDWL